MELVRTTKSGDPSLVLLMPLFTQVGKLLGCGFCSQWSIVLCKQGVVAHEIPCKAPSLLVKAEVEDCFDNC